MKVEALISLLAAVGLATAQRETVLGAYIFSRHGDRTSKSTPPVNLTDLGYQQVYTSGNYYRNRYIANGAGRQIYGISSNVVDQSQVSASAPSDIVLQNSAQGFLQGLYPPVGQNFGQTLRNGTVVQSPLNGYQLIPVNMLMSGSNAESSLWLQGSSGCDKAQKSSNDYFSSNNYQNTYNQSMPLYQRIYPDVQGTFNQSQTNYKNAYAIWDLLNVASIHNQSATLPSNGDFSQLRTLANQAEYNLAYSPNSSVRAIGGSMMAGEVLQALNSSVYNQNQPKLNVQFGTYAQMLSYFGLSNLTNDNSDFYGIPNYASTMVWELVTNSSVSGNSLVSPNDTYVRFYFVNGTATNNSQPVEYSLFNTGRTPLSWNDFVSGTQNFSVSGTSDWCKVCGNSTGLCSTQALAANTGNIVSKGKSGISKAVAGVIGAMVTLGVLGLLGALGFCLFRSRRKRVPVQSTASTSTYRNEYVTEPKPAEYRSDYTASDYRTRGSVVSDTAPIATTTRDMTTTTRNVPTTVVTEPVTTGVTHPTTVVTDHQPMTTGTTGFHDTYTTPAAMREHTTTTGLNSDLGDTVATTGVRDHTTTGLNSGLRDTVNTTGSGLRDTVTATGTRGVTGTTGLGSSLGNTVTTTGTRDLAGTSGLRDGYSTTAVTDHQPGMTTSTGLRDTIANAATRGQQSINTAVRGKNVGGGTVHDITTSPV